MNSQADSPRRSKGPSPAERAWREALRRAGYNVAPTTIAVPPHLLINPAADKRAAEAAYVEFVVAEPDNLMALDGLAFLRQHRGDWTGALKIRRQRYAAEARQLGIAEDSIPEVVEFLASSLGDGQAPAAAPTPYVASLFDHIAATYDEQLVSRLYYRGPDVLLSAVRDVLGNDASQLDILDLGCGTGLAGVAFRPVARRLTGVDLSQGMLSRATGRGVYDELQQAEIVEFLRSTSARYDLIVAADVLNYLGDLQPTFSAVARVLRPGGHLAATVEAGTGDDFRLRGKRRYQHSSDYLHRMTHAARLETRALQEIELRRELDEPVLGWCGVWQATSTPA